MKKSLKTNMMMQQVIFEEKHLLQCNQNMAENENFL
jgi:hypothetical protein|tara:strand:+ start:314 stop:421 length:108 start_codon:yes stop_codon:yes gene_type:complete